MDFTHQRSFWIRIAQTGALVSVLVAGYANAQEKAAEATGSAASTSAPEASAPAASVPAGATHVAPVPAPLVEPDPDSVVARYPSGSIQSVDTANKALEDVQAQHDALDKKYAAEQHDCYSKFFATSCLDAAKERHRVGSEKVHKVEVEANAFIRSDRVVQRDKKLAEKRGNDSTNPPKPLTDLPIKAVQQNDAERATEHQQRLADHDAKMKQLQQDQINDASKRAANVAAHNKKIQDAQARQADVAKKKEEKAKQAAAKSAASNSGDAATSKIGVVPGASTPDAVSAPASKP